MTWLQTLQEWQAHVLFVSILYFLTWAYTLRGKSTFLIDDDQGIARFDDVFLQEKDKDGKVLKEWVKDTYEHEENGKKTTFKNLQFNPLVGFPECYTRWLRLLFGSKFTKIGTNSKNQAVYGNLQSPTKHHLLSFIFFYIGIILTYFFLSKVFGAKLAVISTSLFLVHPMCAQVVGWISCVGYLFCFLSLMVVLNSVVYISNPIVSGAIAFIFTFFANTGVLVAVGLFLILGFLGFYWAAGASLLMTFYCLYQLGFRYVKGRVKAFKEQEMHRSTKLNWRKSIVMVKTIWYYMKLVPFPKRLGLYHKYGYHYDEFVERVDLDFLLGFLAICCSVAIFFIAPFPIQFGILWFFAFLAVFTNFVTAQQFVAERYIFIPTLGFSIILSYLLQDHLAVLAFIGGLYMMKTLLYLPAFNDQTSFYLDNAIQFDGFEVPVGNLGVVYANRGLHYKALDTWFECSKTNPDYDVALYNIYAFFKKMGQLEEGKQYLKRAIDSKICHFPKLWEEEYKQLEEVLMRKKVYDLLQQRFNDAVARNDFNEANYCKNEIDQFLANERRLSEGVKPTNGKLDFDKYLEKLNQVAKEIK